MIKFVPQVIAARFGRHTRKPSQPELLLLMYHRILPADDPRAQQEEPGMFVTPDTFRMHMSTITAMFQPVHLSHWLDKKAKGEELPERCIAVTFDDGWADNYEYAFPVLQELNVPATIFLVSDMIGTESTFWPERLSQTLSIIAQQHPEKWTEPSLNWIRQIQSDYTFAKEAPTQEQLSAIIADCKSLNDEEIHHRLDIIDEQLSLKLADEKPALLSWQQVNKMAATGLVETGSHTCRHIRLTDRIDPALLESEIINSKKTVEQMTGMEVRTFCFPNGDYSERALELVKANYLGAVTTQHGWNVVDTDGYLLNRIGLHEDISRDRTSFLARLSGWM